MIEFITTQKEKPVVITHPIKNMWINAVCPDGADIAQLKSFIDIPDEVFVWLKDSDEPPRVEDYDKFMLFLLRIPVILNDGKEAQRTTVPIGIILSPNYFVTICYNKEVTDLVGELKKQKVFIHKKVQTALKLFLLSAKMYLDHLKSINKKVYKIEEELLTMSLRNEDLIKLLDIQKLLIYYNTSIKANYMLLKKLTKNRQFTGDENDKDLIEDVLIEYRQAGTLAKIYSQITNEMFGSFSSVISNNLNKVMKTLTSITLILMIPTLVASIYGMNVPLPFQNAPYAFGATMAISIIVTLTGVILFLKKKLF